MKNLFSLFVLTFLLAGFQMQAQTATEQENAGETKTTVTKTCGGSAMKVGCCASKMGAQGKADETATAKSDKRGKKASEKKGKHASASCCAGKVAASCPKMSGEMSGKACKPGCEMACCAKKE